MKKHLYSILLLFLSFAPAGASPRTIHSVVALCDNENQGIVPVPAAIGNGQDPGNNLYWGCGYGVKTFFTKKSASWKLVQTWKNPVPHILERALFKHTSLDIWMLADAWDGAYIREATECFLEYASGANPENILHEGKTLAFGGAAQLITWTGHDGLMDFDLDETYPQQNQEKREVIILACISKSYFAGPLRSTGASPLLWTTGLMAPEAYTMEAAINGWTLNESADQIRERAAQAYNQYQKCGLKGARNLLVTGW